jgi:hypothetical protein
LGDLSTVINTTVSASARGMAAMERAGFQIAVSGCSNPSSCEKDGPADAKSTRPK